MCMYLFPSSMVQNPLPEAARARNSVKYLIPAHVLIAIVGVFYIHFRVLLINIFYIACLYSVRQSLNQAIMWIYMGTLMINVLFGVIAVWFQDGIGFFIYLSMMGLYVLFIYFFSNETHGFRNTQGAVRDHRYINVGKSASEAQYQRNTSAVGQPVKGTQYYDDEKYQNTNDPIWQNHWINQVNQQNQTNQGKSTQQSSTQADSGRTQMMDRYLNDIQKP